MTLATRTVANATLTIDLDAITANVRTIRRHTPVEIMAVVKADGFGPGDDHEPTTADWTRWAHTVEHEIVTGLGPRLHRIVASRRTA